MPYIQPSRRPEIDAAVNRLSDAIFLAGDLNYAITRLIQEHMRCINYHNINEIIGVLECAKLEFYRRVASPYEDDKITENGDAYWA